MHDKEMFALSAPLVGFGVFYTTQDSRVAKVYCTIIMKDLI